MEQPQFTQLSAFCIDSPNVCSLEISSFFSSKYLFNFIYFRVHFTARLNDIIWIGFMWCFWCANLFYNQKYFSVRSFLPIPTHSIHFFHLVPCLSHSFSSAKNKSRRCFCASKFTATAIAINLFY